MKNAVMLDTVHTHTHTHLVLEKRGVYDGISN